jgi:hypothetical protein
VEQASFKIAGSSNVQVQVQQTVYPGQYGNLGRNGLDAEVHKQFRTPCSEHQTLQFRFEALNVMNHPNWNLPGLNILSGAAQPGLPRTAAHANFDVVTGTSRNMRQLQLGQVFVLRRTS